MQTVYGIKAHGGKLVNLKDFSEATRQAAEQLPSLTINN